MRLGKKVILHIFSLFILFTTISAPAQAKSVYAIIDRSSTVRAYKINGEKIEEQIDVKNLDDHGGAVGLALDPDSGIMFVTYEGSKIIEMVNAKTMISEENPVTEPNATSLAGIVFDESKQKLYAVDRRTDKLFVYLWDPVTKTLTLEGGTYKTLSNIYYAYGLALDESNHRLYVTDATETVRFYDTNDPNFGYKGSIDIVVDSNSRTAVGIAIDPNRHYLYTGAFTGQTGQHPFLVRTDINDINNPAFDEYNVGNYVIGIIADEQTGFVYTTDKDDEIKVFDTETFPSDPCYSDGNDISQPADIVLAADVSYKPPLLTFEKTADINDANCVIPGDYITYTITYNANGHSVNEVNIIDYLPDEVDFNSASEPNIVDYNSFARTVTWNIGSLSPNDSNYVTLTVQVNERAEPNGLITNFVEAESDSSYNTAEVNTPVCYWCGDIIYVDVNAPTDYNTGASWEYAYKDLQNALQDAPSVETKNT